jgi:hypothetical protein
MFLSNDILRDKFRGAILGCFLGDSFGAGFEGMNPEKARFHMSILSKKFPRSYTDDTDMTLALGESIAPVGMPLERSKLFSPSGLGCNGIRWAGVFLKKGPLEMELPCESLLLDSSIITIWMIFKRRPLNRQMSPMSILWVNGER